MLMPCLLCDLKLDASVDGYVPHDGEVKHFETAAVLRDHLVESHSKFVARALLAPDVTDKAHFWLLANIEYNTNIKPSDDEGLLSNELAASFFDVGDSALAMGVQPITNDYLFGSDEGTPPKPNRRKRKPLRIDDLANKLQPDGKRLDSLFGNEATLENSLFESLLLEEPSEAAVVPNGSRAVRKSTCQVCHVDVCTTARQRHVYQIHLRVSNLFQCSACDYTNNNSVWEMRKHCTAVHQGGAQPISNEELHKQDIQGSSSSCDEGTQNSAAEESGSQNGTYEDGVAFDLDDETGSSQPPDGLVIDDRTCHICWEESRYPGRHIAQKHLKKPLYECPVCEGFGSYESCTVTKHITKVHPLHCDTPPISNLERFADEIRDLQARCFPNRPMKLVRPHAGSRPRERHICQLCKTQVAQSDRQRHVYHRHLQRQRIFECPLCNFASNYDVHRVKWHIKWMHKEDATIEPAFLREEIDRLNEQCFPGWQHRRRPFWWLDTDEAEKRVEQVKQKIRCETKEDDATQSIAAISPSPSTEKMVVAKSTARDSEWTCQFSSMRPNLWTHLDFTLGKNTVFNQFFKTTSADLFYLGLQLCKKEFKPSSNFLRHVAKDHLNIPLYQCPVCEGHGGQDAYEIRSHMLKVHGSIQMDPISNLEEHANEIQTVYQQCFPGRKLKNLPIEKKQTHESKTYDDPRVQCRECGQEMKTEDRQIHVYRHHLKEPRLYECPLCDFAHHACSSDVKAHIKYAHRENAHLTPKANLLEFSKEISEWNLRCFPGWINRRLPAAALEDFNRCRICDVEVRQTSRHIAEVHLKMSLHQCPVCDYGAAESRLVRRHMKNNHKKKEVKGLEPIANVVEHRQAFSELHDQCFPGRPKRLSNITISDEGRRAKCRQCGATISRKRRLTHLLERHLKRNVYRCSKCDFASMHDENEVNIHIKDEHEGTAEVVNDLKKYKSEVEPLATSCFIDWQLRV
ncbi:unnamed protein product [Toxocara canis]|uniref:C2H2-type domain-containing protein n=1 Tax=Toxocara canis TaxID=6265 RepID=A0A183URB0_TOXCA|nr:unnamed protein product [Toxocara canis]